MTFRFFHEYAKGAKIPNYKMHLHALKHSIAVHMADSGVSVERVKDHLRHCKIDSTMVYLQITSKEDAREPNGGFKSRICGKIIMF